MEDRLSRTRALLGDGAIARLAASHILLAGLGGVGGHAFDALVRSGVGAITVCDFDTVTESNKNRQLLANSLTVGRLKAEVAREHAALISENVNITLHTERLTPESVESLLSGGRFDLVIDAVDDVAVKVALAAGAYHRGLSILSCLGTANRLDPTALRFTDIGKTSGCPLARAVRTRLRKQGVPHLRVLVSSEPPITPFGDVPLGSVAYVPSVAGLLLCAEAVRLLTDNGRDGTSK